MRVLVFVYTPTRDDYTFAPEASITRQKMRKRMKESEATFVCTAQIARRMILLTSYAT